jgi:predicted AAA+ superfamily ATPase
MEELFSFQNNVLAQVNDTWHRYLYGQLRTQERLLGIKGLRGVGKTTLLLQYLAFAYPEKDKGLYVTADHPYFYDNSLFGLAEAWYAQGGKLLIIDEVHKYPNWSRELKLMYDGFKNLQVLFTSSSALNLYQGESDLSRRLATQELHGLSFREYLGLVHNLNFAPLRLADILEKHQDITADLTRQFKPLAYFKTYVKEGYFPFVAQVSSSELPARIINILNTVLESDLTYIEGYSASNIVKIKRLLGAIAESAPFEPNISGIASKLSIGRNSVVNYLKHLNDAQVLHLLNRPAKGISALQKPDKIYFENTCMAYALKAGAEIGTVRETFFANQLKNAGHHISLSAYGDFLIDDKYTVEIGGKSKSRKQIVGLENALLIKDDIEHGFGTTIPLWLFGFLY